MKYEHNMTGWRKALADNRIEIKIKESENRLNSLRRLALSGLKTYDYKFVKLTEFYENEKIFSELEKKHGSLVIRVCDENDVLQRYTLIDKKYSEIKEFLKEKILDKDTSKYTVAINEYDPAKYCGVIISSKDTLIIEMVKEPNLEKLCHGASIPWSAEFNKQDLHHFNRMIYKNIENDGIKYQMWNIVKSISKIKHYEDENTGLGIPQYEPLKGYLEFCISAKTGELHFIDYKP